MTPFRWTITVNGATRAEAQRQHRDLVTRTLAHAPHAMRVLLPTRAGLTLLDEQDEPLDLHDFPFDLAEQLRAFYGPGLYELQQPKFENAYLSR